MKSDSTTPDGHAADASDASGRWSRRACGVVGLTIGAATVAALLLAFDRAGPAQWITPTPDVLESLADCEALRQRADRDTCVRELVASHSDPEPPAVRIAGH